MNIEDFLLWLSLFTSSVLILIFTGVLLHICLGTQHKFVVWMIVMLIISNIGTLAIT